MLPRTLYLDSTSWKRLEDVLKTFSKRLEDILNMSWRRFCKTSGRCVENVMKTSWQDVLVRRLKNVLKTYGQDEYIGLDQDFFWRRKAKANIFILIQDSSRRLQDVFWRRKTSWRRLQEVFIKTNVCRAICHLPTKRSVWDFDVTNRTNGFYNFQSYYQVVMYLWNSLAKSCMLFWKYS